MKALAALSQFVNKTFALWVLVFAAIAYAAPDPFKPLAGWISPLLGLVMFGMGLTLSVNDFKLVLSKPVDVLIGILAQFIIMPTLAYLLCIVLQLPAEIAVGVILVGCCPGGTSSNVMTFLARGDTALSVTITSCTTLLAPIVTPALIWLFAHQWIEIDPLGMFWSICQIVLIPIAIGVAIHTILGQDRVAVAATCLPLISVVSIVLIVMAVVAVSQPNIAKSGPLVFAVVVLHNGLGYVVGYLAAKLFKMNKVLGHRSRHAELGPWGGACDRTLCHDAASRSAFGHLQLLAQHFRPDRRNDFPPLDGREHEVVVL